MTKPITGSISIQKGETFYSIQFETNGWIAAELVQYLNDLYSSDSVEVGILKLLGYTLQMTDRPPARKADHWVEIDIHARVLRTNSELIRRAVKQESPAEEGPYWEPALKRIYAALDAQDFNVQLLS